MVTARSEKSARVHPWDGFQAGPETALAQAAIRALAQGERLGISPLVIHGAAGVGKSRLLAALTAEVLERQPRAAVALLTAEDFAAACAAAAAAGQIDGWTALRERFRRLDLFALDDLQALERAPMAIAELTHTLDALDAAGAAVAIAARSGPGQWSQLPRRLVSRIAGGLAVLVEPPGLDARRRYLLDQARVRRLTVPAAAVEPLAEAADGFRAIDGLLARLALETKLERKPMGPPAIAVIIQEPGTLPDAITPERITQAVASRFGVRARDLRSASRRAAVVLPRHIAIHLTRRHCGLSYAAIGRYFGRRDPATIRHSCAIAAARLAADPALAASTEVLAAALPVRRGAG